MTFSPQAPMQFSQSAIQSPDRCRLHSAAGEREASASLPSNNLMQDVHAGYTDCVTRIVLGSAGALREVENSQNCFDIHYVECYNWYDIAISGARQTEWAVPVFSKRYENFSTG